MTISQHSSAPLFVVVGATGGQGGSVIRAIQASSISYCVRAISRDASKPQANALQAIGCDVVEANVKTAEGAKKAFEGADIVFIMTLSEFTSPDFAQKEFEAAVLQIDTAKAAGVNTVIWSGMQHISNLSGGKNSVPQFENKADVTAYARSLEGIKVIDVQPGAFFSNYFTVMRPRKLEDGSFVMAAALDPDTKVPLIDIDADYGKYVVGALENGIVNTLFAAPEYTTSKLIAEGFAKATGKKVIFSRLPDEQLHAILVQIQNKVAADNMVAMFRAFRDVGHFAGADLASSNEILSTPAGKLDDILTANAERVAELFA